MPADRHRLHRFMDWPGPILTDSGGLQVMSLGALRTLDADGVTFRSHLDGSTHCLTPERSTRIQHELDATITMCFDECTQLPATDTVVRAAMELSMRWAERSRAAFVPRPGYAQFGIRGDRLRRLLSSWLGCALYQRSGSGGSGKRLQVLPAMKRISCLLCIVTLCCNNVVAAQAAKPAGAMWNPDGTMPTLIDVASAAAHARSTSCNTTSCKAIIVIDELIDIARYEDGDANGVASLHRGRRPQIAGRRLDHVLLDHPALFGPVCATGAELMRKVRLGPGIYEMIVPVQLLVQGVDMDLRNHGHCTHDLLAALPGTPANAEVRQNAHVLCIYGDENHHRPKAACDVLIQGLHAGR